MYFLNGKPLSRRTFVRGMGATVAIPFLDAMVPIGRGAGKAAAAERTRFVAIEMVHGAAGSNELGAKLNLWSPAAVGKNFDLSPTALGWKHIHFAVRQLGPGTEWRGVSRHEERCLVLLRPA